MSRQFKTSDALLRELIKEEVHNLLSERSTVVFRDGEDLYTVDHNGEENFLEPVEGSEFDWLEDGEETEADVPDPAFAYKPHSYASQVRAARQRRFY